jgi:AcrR family transcriptional regulator
MHNPEENAKYQAIMRAAKDQFWKYGLRKVSIEDICRAASVSKMTFYRFFTNKVELARTVFDAAVQEGALKFYSILNDDSPVPEKISRMIQMKLEGTKDISREFLMDLYTNTENGLKEHVEKTTAESWNKIIRYFRLAQRRGIFRRDIKPEFLLYFSKKIGEMITDESLIRQYGSPQELIHEFTSFFIYGIVDRTVKW